MLSAVAMALSLGSMPGTPMDEAEPLPAISSFIMMVATAILFLDSVYRPAGLLAGTPVGRELSQARGEALDDQAVVPGASRGPGDTGAHLEDEGGADQADQRRTDQRPRRHQ